MAVIPKSSVRPLHLWYTVITLTGVYSLVLLAGSHITHSLILITSSYQTLCNFVFLLGSTISIKKTAPKVTNPPTTAKDELRTLAKDSVAPELIPSAERLKNTFGWVRIDVLVLLVGSVLLCSFSFSVGVKAVQTFIHIGHEAGMEHPLVALQFGVGGIFLNLMTYWMLGGIYFSRPDLLTLSSQGDVIVNSSDLSLSKSAPTSSPPIVLKAVKDNAGYVFVVLCGVLAYVLDEGRAKYVDSSVSLVSNVFILLVNFPFLNTSCCILLQTIPNHVTMEGLTNSILQIPEVVNIHDFHVWRLTEEKSVASVHIIFRTCKDYLKVNDQILKLFHQKSIANVTIQPEFSEWMTYNDSKAIPSNGVEFCQFRCKGNTCNDAVCCSIPECQLGSVHIETSVAQPASDSLKQSSNPPNDKDESKENGK